MTESATPLADAFLFQLNHETENIIKKATLLAQANAQLQQARVKAQRLAQDDGCTKIQALSQHVLDVIDLLGHPLHSQRLTRCSR